MVPKRFLAWITV